MKNPHSTTNKTCLSHTKTHVPNLWSQSQTLLIHESRNHRIALLEQTSDGFFTHRKPKSIADSPNAEETNAYGWTAPATGIRLRRSGQNIDSALIDFKSSHRPRQKLRQCQRRSPGQTFSKCTSTILLPHSRERSWTLQVPHVACHLRPTVSINPSRGSPQTPNLLHAIVAHGGRMA